MRWRRRLLPGWTWAVSQAGSGTREEWTAGVQQWSLPKIYWPGNLLSCGAGIWALLPRRCRRSPRTPPEKDSGSYLFNAHGRSFTDGGFRPLTHHNPIGHEEHHPTKDMNHEEGHGQTAQVIILTAAEDISVTCGRARSRRTPLWWCIILKPDGQN